MKKLYLASGIVAVISLALLIFGIYTELRPKPETTSTTKPREFRETQCQNFRVDGDTEDFSTGIDVTGKFVRITYLSGMWTSGDNKWSDARGGGLIVQDPEGLYLPNAPIRTLVGFTDNNSKQNYNEIPRFYIGVRYQGMPGTGVLHLHMNDRRGFFNDNGGYVNVRVCLLEER